MKKLFSTLLLVVGLALPAFSQTNTPATNAPSLQETAKQVVATNLNQVLIEILSGTKDAAKEIYGASKEAIHKGIDFVGEQAPDVIKQFLTWRFCEAGVWVLIWTAIACVLFLLAGKCLGFQKRREKAEKTDDDSYQMACFFKWVFMLVALGFLIGFGGENALEMVKIKVAPKVYIIEYVVDLIHGNQPK